MMTEQKSKASFGQLRTKIFDVFLPGTPISDFDFFAGRKQQMNAVTTAIKQHGRHAILFGERGVGKTSLAKVLVELENKNGFVTLTDGGTVDCDESDDFSSLWHKVFSGLSIVYGNSDTLISPDDVRVVLNGLRGDSLIVIDEVDQLKDENAKSLLAATIKNLSNHRTKATLLLVGVADTVNELIVEQKSAERALIQVRMPRMSPQELFEIINNGLEQLEMTIDSDAKTIAIALSQRFPFYTHSFGLYAGLKAIDAGRRHIERKDVIEAVLDVVLNAENIRRAYYTATKSTQSKNRYELALIACALSEQDVMGFFPAAEMCKWMSALLGRKYGIPGYVHYLAEFSENKRGNVLDKVGERGNVLYRFADPLMQPFVYIKAFGEGKISTDLLQLTREQMKETGQSEDLPF